MKKDTTLILAILMIGIGAVGLLSINSPGFGRTSLMGGMMGSQYTKTQFSSNGERIYYTATSESGKTITSTMGMMTMATPIMSCVDCHGENGKGGVIRMMMGNFEAPDIRYKTLIAEVHEHEGEEHPPYTDELIKRAITQGLNSAGESLQMPMPLWSMSDEDLEDLIEYLKLLNGGE